MSAPGTVTIVLADDHAVVRTGLRMLLDAEEGFEVVAEAGDADSAAAAVREFAPEVLVLDLTMPGTSTLELLPELAAACRVIVLTMQDDPAFAREALRAGAHGYVPKQGAGAELVEAIRVVVGGGTYLNPELGARMAAEPAAADPEVDLTPRERDVLRLIALGNTNNEIAAELFLSVRTIETHRSHIQRKLGISRRAELVRYALDNRLIDD